MKAFRFFDTKGNDLGTYQACDEHQAREVFADKAGYENFCEMLEFSTIGRLRVIDVTVATKTVRS